MGYGYGFRLENPVVAAATGIALGGVQGAILDTNPTILGTSALVPQIGTNADLFNLTTGIAGTTLGLAGATGHTFMSRYPVGSAVLGGYGVATLTSFAVRKLVTSMSGTASAARRAAQARAQMAAAQMASTAAPAFIPPALPPVGVTPGQRVALALR